MWNWIYMDVSGKDNLVRKWFLRTKNQKIQERSISNKVPFTKPVWWQVEQDL